MDVVTFIKNIKIEENLKKNYKYIIIPFIVYLICNLVLESTLSFFPDSVIDPTFGLTSIFGLLYGPYGALGSSLANLIVYIFYYNVTPVNYVPFFLTEFLWGYMTYKLWYFFSNKKTVSIPRINSVYTLLKFLSIILITTIVFSFLILAIEINGSELSLYGLQSAFYNVTPTFILDGFVFSYIFGIIAISIVNMKNLNVIIPTSTTLYKNQNTISNISLILAVIILIAGFLYSNFNLNNFHDLFIYLIIILLFIYLNKPIKHKVKRKDIYYNKVFGKILLIFLIFSFIFMTTLGMLSYFHFLPNIKFINPSLSLLFYMLFGIIVFQLPGVIVLYYIEKHFTTPLSIFVKTTRNYLKDKNDSNDTLKKYSQYIESNDEIGDLAQSFSKLITNLDEYMDNLMKVTSEKERMETELNLAKKIQESILPSNSFDDEKFKIDASMKPAREVGGDFYDIFKIDENKIAIVIGDASGKGIPAAIFSVIASSLIKDQLKLGISPGKMMHDVNNNLTENNEESMFVTVWVGVLDLNNGQLTFVNAGHNNPIIYDGDKFSYLTEKHGLVLGAMEDMFYKENTITLKNQDMIFIYTDGITEAHNIDDELFGEDKLINLLNNNYNLNELIPQVFKEVEDFSGSRSQFDDMTMLVLQYFKK